MTLFLSMLLACVTQLSRAAVNDDAAQFRVAHEAPAPNATEMVARDDKRKFYVDSSLAFSSSDFMSCHLGWSKENGWVLTAKASPAGRQKILTATKDNVGKRIGVLSLGYLWSAPQVKQAIDSGAVTMAFPSMSKDESARLAALLRESCGRESTGG